MEQFLSGDVDLLVGALLDWRLPGDTQLRMEIIANISHLLALVP